MGSQNDPTTSETRKGMPVLGTLQRISNEQGQVPLREELDKYEDPPQQVQMKEQTIKGP